MHDNKTDGLQLLVEENQTSRAKLIDTAEKLYSFKKHFCKDELPTLTSSIKSLENLPAELKKIIEEAEKKVCSKNDIFPQNKTLLSVIPKEKWEVVTSTFGDSLLQNIVLSGTLPKEYDIFTAGIAAVTTSAPIVGAAVNIFRAMSQKKKFKEQLQKKEKATQSSTEIFQSAINKMEFLLESTEERVHEISEGITILSEGPKNYEMMSRKQQEELMQLATRMNALSQEFTQKIGA